MDIGITTNPSRRAAYVHAQTGMAYAEGKSDASVPASSQDVIAISPAAREAMAKQATQVASASTAGAVSEKQADGGAVTAFTSFAEQFDKVTQDYSDAIREHYAKEHEENLTYDDPSAHIWDKYKNPDSPDFRAVLSEDERAWAFDHEQDLLNGGKHFQMGNPYVFDTPPTLSTAAMQANQACREQIGQSIQTIFAESGIEVPEGASFRLTVDASYTIHVAGLEDEELAQSMERALNSGDNGKNLYNHLKITAPDGEVPGVGYADGHLEELDPQQELGDDALAEVKKQIGPAYFHYSEAYNPHQGPLGVIIQPGMREPTPAEQERTNAIVRLGAPEMIARFRAGEFALPDLVVNKYAEVDPDFSIATKTYFDAYVQQAMTARKTVEDYYAAAHRENSSYPFAEGIQHIEAKYKLPDSPLFRFDLPPAQRDMYYRQEMALLKGTPLTMLDPYALASIGGVQTAEAAHQIAMQAVREKLEQLRSGLL